MDKLKQSAEELIRQIVIIDGNLQHIASTGKINGSLFISIKKVMQEYADQEAQSERDKILGLLDGEIGKLKSDVVISDQVCQTSMRKSRQERYFIRSVQLRAKIEALTELTKLYEDGK